MNQSIRLPRQAEKAIMRLNAWGKQAYVVGGCVRDSLRGEQPNDWDITTSARPEEIKRCFAGCKTIDTGIRHGTVTVMLEDMPLEITTYRVDGDYSDRRHPDAVKFTHELKEDLRRRDFTINAMAYHPVEGLMDYFDGGRDLLQGIIRCVGEPERRFSEDALRILRGLRFASTLNFNIEKSTAAAIHKKRGLLQQVAAERLSSECSRLLTGRAPGKVLLEYEDVLEVFIPELGPMVGFEQRNPHHTLDVWGHTVKGVESVENSLALRLAALLHDIGKPRCFTLDEKRVGHFYHHAEIGAQMAASILQRLRYDRETAHLVENLVACHNLFLEPTEKAVKHALSRYGKELLLMLLALKRADILAQSPVYLEENMRWLGKIKERMEALERQDACFSLRQLAIGGRELISLGIPEGKEIGRTLHWLLDAVIDERVENSEKALIRLARQYRENQE